MAEWQVLAMNAASWYVAPNAAAAVIEDGRRSEASPGESSPSSRRQATSEPSPASSHHQRTRSAREGRATRGSEKTDRSYTDPTRPVRPIIWRVWPQPPRRAFPPRGLQSHVSRTEPKVYSKGSSDRNRSLGASQPISNGLLMLRFSEEVS